MTKKRTRGGKYERNDGTTIADDHIDRRFRLVTTASTETIENPEKRKASEKSINHYIIKFKDGTRLEVEGASEKSVRATYAGTGDKAILDIEKVKKRN